jgi:hypothetical protein
MNEVFDVIKKDAMAVDALEDVEEPLADQAEMLDVGEGQGLNYKEEELVGKVKDGGRVGGPGMTGGQSVRGFVPDLYRIRVVPVWVDVGW